MSEEAFLDFYSKILEASESNFDSVKSESDLLSGVIAAHNDAMILEFLIQHSKSEAFSETARLALLEIQNAFMNLMIGSTRNSYSSLRAALELVVGGIHFSTDYVHFNLWKNGHEDLHWSVLVDEEKGVFSNKFTRAFAPDLRSIAEQFRQLAKTLYRECSEFVHCNPSSADIDKLKLNHDPDEIRYFLKRVEGFKVVCLYLFVCRFFDAIENDLFHSFESVIVENFGQIPEIRSIYE